MKLSFGQSRTRILMYLNCNHLFHLNLNLIAWWIEQDVSKYYKLKYFLQMKLAWKIQSLLQALLGGHIFLWAQVQC